MNSLSLLKVLRTYYGASYPTDGANAVIPFVILVFLIIASAIVFIIIGITKAINKGSERPPHDITSSGIAKTTPLTASKTSSTGLDFETRAVRDYLNGLIAPDEFVFVGVTLPAEEGKEPIVIEYVLVSRKGVFSIDGNYWRGEIVGTATSEYWKVKNGGFVYNYKNPFQQNEKAGMELAKMLDFKYDVKNAVIFNKFDTTTPVANIAFEMESFKAHYDNMPDEMDYSEVRKVAEKIRLKTQIKYDSKK